jgi:predicted Zn-ribbon and HTH transcriptional regulator
MPKAWQKVKVRPNEAVARAINATDWQPLSGMMKKRCSQCRYWFAVPITEAEATSRCPDCVRPTRPAAPGG